MVQRRTTGSLAAAVAVAALAACSSSATGGSGSVDTGAPAASHASWAPSSAAPSSAARSSASPSAGGTAAAGASGLAYRLHRAATGLTSDHLVFTTTAGGQTIKGTGDQKLSGGRTVAFTLTESLPEGGSLGLIKVGDRTWAKLPGTASTAKPWALVSASSSDPQVRALAQGLQTTTSAQSLQTTGVFVASARSVRDVGAVTVGGVRTTHYAVVIDPGKLPADFPQKAAIVSSGLTSIPVDLYVDGRDRPVRTVEHITAGGTTVDSTITLSRFNAPVTITAPPPSQVSTR